jgi:hypothetical protein
MLIQILQIILIKYHSTWLGYNIFNLLNEDFKSKYFKIEIKYFEWNNLIANSRIHLLLMRVYYMQN